MNCEQLHSNVINSPRVTGCECRPTSFPFACPRHGGCIKSAHFWGICQSRPDFFELFESGSGPCLPTLDPVVDVAAPHRNGTHPALPAMAHRNPTCIHRLPIIEVGTCDLCGAGKGNPFEVLGCSIHGQCSFDKKHSKIKSCSTCMEGEPIASE